jgi:copper homeostasis protein
MMELEICVDSVESATAAETGGAQRVELCSALSEGGLTPSAGMIQAVRDHVKIGLYVMIRPRGGDFFYSDHEFAIMKKDIAVAVKCGADGVVFGLLTCDGNIDVKRTRELVETAHSVGDRSGPAKPLEVTFHRAIDMTHNFKAATAALLDTGVDRVLTSGGEQTALLGKHRIREMFELTSGHIKIMAGGGVRPTNVRDLARFTGIVEFHAAMRSVVASPVLFRKEDLHLGDADSDEYTRRLVLADDVLQLRQAIDAIDAVEPAAEALKERDSATPLPAPLV